MEWRDIPDWPGYQINEKGRVRLASGYMLTTTGKRYALTRNGRREYAPTADLLALAFPPHQAEVMWSEASKDLNAMLVAEMNDLRAENASLQESLAEAEKTVQLTRKTNAFLLKVRAGLMAEVATLESKPKGKRRKVVLEPEKFDDMPPEFEEIGGLGNE